MDLMTESYTRCTAKHIENMFSIPVIKYRCHNWKQKKQDFLALLNEQTLTMGEESVYSDYGEYDTLTAEHEMGLYDTPNYLNRIRTCLLYTSDAADE